MVNRLIILVCAFSFMALSQDNDALFKHLLQNNNTKIRKVYLSNDEFVEYYNAFYSKNIEDLKDIFPVLKYLSSGTQVQSVAIYYFKSVGINDSLKYLPLSVGINTIIILKGSGKGTTDSLAIENKYVDVLFPRDFKTDTIKKNYYSNIVSKKDGDTPESFVGKGINDYSNSIQSLNKKFNEYQRINHPFASPIKIAENGKHNWMFLGFSDSQSDSIILSNKEKYFYFDINLSRLSISWNAFYQSVKNMPIGFEVTADEDIMNMLPYQNMSCTFGTRLLLPLSDLYSEGQYLYITDNTTTLDLKIMYRTATDSRNIYFKPLFHVESPILNVGSAFGADFIISKFYKYLPSLHGTIFSASHNFSKRIIEFKENDVTVAYHSFFQAQFLMNFFKEIGNENHKLKIDIGIGTYDVYKAAYDSSKKFVNADLFFKKIIQPIVDFTYTLVLNNSSYKTNAEGPILGLSARIFEERVKAMFWITCLNWWKNKNNIDLRIETQYLSLPLFRVREPWENEGGMFFQIRLRYALNSQII